MPSNALFLALAMSAAIASSVAAQSPTNANPVIMTVNGEAIYAAEVTMQLSAIVQPGQQPDQRAIDFATSKAIELKLMAQEATRRDLQVDRAAIDENLGRMAEQAGGRDALIDNLAKGGVTIEQVTGQLEEVQLMQLLLSSMFSEPVGVTEEELVAFKAANPKEFYQPDLVHARHILIKTTENYDDAAKAEALGRAQKARARALAGEDFETLAKELSEGPSAPNGGDLGFFDHAQMVPDFSDAAFALSKTGDVSEVVETQFGYHVIQMVDREAGGDKTIDEVREPLTKMLEDRKTRELIVAFITELADEATILDQQGRPVDKR